MTTVDYLQLRKGTDVCGIATALTEGQPIDLTEEAVSSIAKAFCVWLSSRTRKLKVRVAIGYDSRLSSPFLCEAAVTGILSIGHDAIVTDMSTTPAMLTLLQDNAWQNKYPCDGSIMITASHLPAEYNGLKFFFGDGSLSADSIDSILYHAESATYPEITEIGQRIEAPYLDEYADRLVNMIRVATGEELPLLDKRIVVDAGNGVGGFFVSKVLAPLGADTAGSQYLEPDGNFPHYVSNPENAECIASLANAVLTAKAQLGILFSADGERVGAVDQYGNLFNRNRLIALMSAIVLSERPGTIVTDSITSDGLTKFIEARGGKHHRFMRGHQNVINEALRLNSLDEYTPLAIETSGHAAMLENEFHDDSMYLITRMLIAFVLVGKHGYTLTDVIADLEQPKEAFEVRLPILDEKEPQLTATRAICEYAAYALRTPYITPADENYEGCRVNYDEKHGDGWAMLRMSLHENTVPINIESNSEHGVLKMAKDIYYFLKNIPYLDVAPLKEAINMERQRLLGNIKSSFYSDAAYLTFIYGEKTVLQGEEVDALYKKPEETATTAESPADATVAVNTTTEQN